MLHAGIIVNLLLKFTEFATKQLASALEEEIVPVESNERRKIGCACGIPIKNRIGRQRE